MKKWLLFVLFIFLVVIGIQFVSANTTENTVNLDDSNDLDYMNNIEIFKSSTTLIPNNSRVNDTGFVEVPYWETYEGGRFIRIYNQSHVHITLEEYKNHNYILKTDENGDLHVYPHYPVLVSFPPSQTSTNSSNIMDLNSTDNESVPNETNIQNNSSINSSENSVKESINTFDDSTGIPIAVLLFVLMVLGVSIIKRD